MRVLFLNICLLLSGIFLFSDIYSIHITTINGVDKSLADFQNKKILIAVLPVTKTSSDSIFLKTIDSLSETYSQDIAIIGVPSFEDGYNTADLNDLRNYYNSLIGSQVIITEGMYTRKTSGEQQHELFSWLSHKEKNIHFDSEVEGARQCFFINGQGELYGIVSPNVGLTYKVMQRMMQ